MAKWNGYIIEVIAKSISKLEFDCLKCDWHIEETFHNTSEFKALRTEWKNHVDTHGGPYS
jgi:hypothetical protein